MKQHILKIRFNKSSSANYGAVIKLSKNFDNFKQENNINEIETEVAELRKRKKL
jgi:hypothetical protein